MNQQKGATEFLEAITRQVAAGETIYLPDGPVARLVSGCTGRWTSGGILRDARSPDIQARPEDCHFLVMMGKRSIEGPKLNRSFTRVFGNSYGTLYKNKLSLPKRESVKAVVSGLSLMVLSLLGMGLLLFDLWWPRQRVRERLLAVGLTLALASACLAKLAWVATDKSRPTPKVTTWRTNMPLSRLPGRLSILTDTSGASWQRLAMSRTVRNKYPRAMYRVMKREGQREDI